MQKVCSPVIKTTTKSMRSIIFYLTFFLSSVNLFSQTYPLGQLELFMEDEERNDRLVTAEIFYPALSEGSILVAEGEFPMIVFAHGFVMPYTSYENIRDYFVDKGFIVMFITTEGSFSPSHEDFAKDINFMTDYIVYEAVNNSQSVFNGHFIPDVALMGHSMGGGASILAANLSTNVKTIIGLAPAETNPSAIEEAFFIEKPTLILSGSGDAVTPPSEHHLPIFDALSSTCKIFLNIKRGAHCYFANEDQACDFGELLSGGDIGIDRAGQQEIMFEYTEAWLNYFLKNEQDAITQKFGSAIENDIRISLTNKCDLLASNNSLPQEFISVYPNPASDLLRLRNNSVERAFQLFNIHGMLMHEGLVFDELNLNNVDNGFYLLKLEGINNVFKITVQKL